MNIENKDIYYKKTIKKFAEMWNKCHRIKAKVIQLNSDWLGQLENIFLSKSSKSSDLLNHGNTMMHQFARQRTVLVGV